MPDSATPRHLFNGPESVMLSGANDTAHTLLSVSRAQQTAGLQGERPDLACSPNPGKEAPMAVTGGYTRDEAHLLLTLCGLTYIDATAHPFESIAAQQARMLKDINSALTASPYGNWQVLWGPALDDERANMMFVAGKQDKSQCAVCVRGTDPQFIINWVQNLSVLDLEDFPYTAAPGVQIAAGTAAGLDQLVHLIGTTANGDQDLVTFLRELNPGAIFVTGHSLGGCLASVVAPWLAHELGSAESIKVYTFAAPSAGNGNFATFYNG